MTYQITYQITYRRRMLYVYPRKKVENTPNRMERNSGPVLAVRALSSTIHAEKNIVRVYSQPFLQPPLLAGEGRPIGQG
jgi:hypothetical protein